MNTLKKQPKNYIGFINDHSGSMQGIASAALKDANSLMQTVKDAASSDKLDTVVSVFGVSSHLLGSLRRIIVNSNPHVLNPMDTWSAAGGTPLYDTLHDMINMYKNLPDANEDHVSFLIMVTTDGEENGSTVSEGTIRTMIQTVEATGRWTFVFRVPKGATRYITKLGVCPDNIQEWDTSAAGMAATTQANTQALRTFSAARAGGKTASGAFYTGTANIDTDVLQDVTSEVSLYVVPSEDTGMQMRTFILRHRMEYLKGAAFYQLTKTEARVSHTKQVIIRDRTTGKLYAGQAARKQIGLPDNRNARLHPGDHQNYDIFIQSESINRYLVGGTGVLYWAKIGVQFTEEELARFNPPPTEKIEKAKAAIVVLPEVHNVSGKPVKSPIPVKPKDNRTFYDTRDYARMVLKGSNLLLQDAGKDAPKGKRWFTSDIKKR